jgi:hypothetical protein
MALVTVSLPAATSIGEYAFANAGKGALTITLPQAAPTVIKYTGYPYNYSKTVTIKRPVGSTGYDDAWQTSFKLLFNAASDTITLRFEDI